VNVNFPVPLGEFRRGACPSSCRQCFDAVLVGWQEGHLACKKAEIGGAGMVICLERGADLHMAQLMPLPLTVPCFSKIQIGFTFLVPAYPCSPGQRAVKRVCRVVPVTALVVRVKQSVLCVSGHVHYF